MGLIFKSAVILGLIASASAFAQGKGVSGGKHEVTMSAGYLGLSASSTQWDLAPGYRIAPFPNWKWCQVGGEIVYQKLSFRGGSTSNTLILAGVTANVGPSTNEAFFVSLGLGIRGGSSDVEESGSSDPTGFGFYFFSGKRFALAGPVTLTPSLGVVAAGTTGMVFRPFAVSVHF